MRQVRWLTKVPIFLILIRGDLSNRYVCVIISCMRDFGGWKQTPMNIFFQCLGTGKDLKENKFEAMETA